MKAWFLTLASLAAFACGSAPRSTVVTPAPMSMTAPAPAPYPAEVAIMCRMEGEANDVVLGKYTKDWKYHGAFRPDELTREFLCLAPLTKSFQNLPSADDCFGEASKLLDPIKANGWSVDKTKVTTGHCWANGVWSNCGGLGTPPPFDTYAFTLLHSGTTTPAPYTDSFLVTDSGGIPRKVLINYYVVVQSK